MGFPQDRIIQNSKRTESNSSKPPPALLQSSPQTANDVTSTGCLQSTDPLPLRDVLLARARAVRFSLPLVKGVVEAALYCAHRATTALSWGLCEQGGHLTAPERLIFLRPRPWLPVQAVIFPAIPRPGIERIHHRLEFTGQFWHRPQQHAFQGRIGVFRTRSVVRDPLDAKRCVELRAKTGGEKPVAEEAARGVENKHDELGFGNGEAMWPPEFRQPPDHGIDVLDVVDLAAVRMT